MIFKKLIFNPFHTFSFVQLRDIADISSTNVELLVSKFNHLNKNIYLFLLIDFTVLIMLIIFFFSIEQDVGGFIQVFGDLDDH